MKVDEERGRYSNLMAEIKQKALLYNSYELTSQQWRSITKRPKKPLAQTRNKKSCSMVTQQSKNLSTTLKKNDSLLDTNEPPKSRMKVISLQKVKQSTQLKEKQESKKEIISPTKLDFMQAKRTPDYIVDYYGKATDMPTRPGLTILLRRAQEVSEYAKGNNHEALVSLCVQLLNQAVDLCDLQLIICMIEFCGDVHYGNGNFEEALYFYNQGRICTSFVGSYTKKIDSLMCMSKCAGKLHHNDQAILFLLKGLQYCYLINDQERELLIYDLLGMCFYSGGEIKQARYYHQRFIAAIPENRGQHSRSYISAREHFVSFSRSIPIMCKEVNSLFLAYLSLPLNDRNNPSLLRLNATHKSTDNCKTNIEKIMKEAQFRDVIDLPKQPVVQFDSESSDRVDPPLKLIIDSILHRSRPLRQRHRAITSTAPPQDKSWINRINKQLKSKVGRSQSVRGRALLTHDGYSNMLLKRQGWEYYYMFVLKGMLISYCELITGRQSVFIKIDV